MSSLPPVPFSVLDLAPVPSGSSPGDALRASTALAQHAEVLGLHRYWVAEHHNMPGIASSAPAVLLAHVAGATSRIRVGSGGVMLPNHPPLVVAEQFGTLDALHPGRIDLGIGRAPGTDQLTAYALRRSAEGLSAEDFPQHLLQLQAFFTGTFPPEHMFSRITAVPGLGGAPQLWLLGSSDFSARLAGALGLRFAFAHHFMAANTLLALHAYRSQFQPSTELAAPHAMLCVNALVADTDAQADRLARPADLSFLLLRAGRPGTLPSIAEADAFPYTAADLAQIQARRADQLIGSPATVRDQLDRLLTTTSADEVMVTTMAHDPADRLHSFDLLAREVLHPGSLLAAASAI